MRFSLTADEIAFRDTLCAFLQSELCDAVRAANADPAEQDGWSPEFTRAFQRRLGAAGYIGMSLPPPFGGGKSLRYQVLLEEELEYHRAPLLSRSTDFVPRAIAAFGTDEQRSTYLPRLCRGEISFWLGYSEPEAGSDLAGLKTKAVANGDTYVISGQKSYSTGAHTADYGWIAVRTDPESPPHRGTSLIIVDMRSPGIRLSRHETVAGWIHDFVYFDDVEVPRSQVVGTLNRGWQITMGGIDFERAAVASAGMVEMQLDRLVTYAAETTRAGRPLLDDDAIADQLADFAIDVAATRELSYWLAELEDTGKLGRYEPTLASLYKRELAREFDYAGVELFGERAPLQHGSAWAPFDGEVERDYRFHLYYQFAAGGFDVTRNVIAIRGLGLPR